MGSRASPCVAAVTVLSTTHGVARTGDPGLRCYGKIARETGVQTSDTSGVLDGDLDEFMAATLAQRAFGTGPDVIEDVD